MKRLGHYCAGALLACWPFLGWAQLSAAEPLAEHSMAQERRALADWQQQQQALCYQKFAVQDCLRDVRQQARQREQALRDQELSADLRQRQDKARQRRQSIAEKQQAADQASGQSPQVTLRQPRADKPAPSAQPRPKAPRAAPADADKRAEQAAQARQRQEAKQQQAGQRRQRYEERQKSRKSDVKPLPVTP